MSDYRRRNNSWPDYVIRNPPRNPCSRPRHDLQLSHRGSSNASPAKSMRSGGSYCSGGTTSKAGSSISATEAVDALNLSDEEGGGEDEPLNN